ncbi:MAG: (2Fe-2S) ferredoxin domain-containing protein [Verrucomicrobiae bacterium]|nr:(2Fe-2S) ferredoxin domain-containing protein [Verrucomicrobiae bacterium]
MNKSAKEGRGHPADDGRGVIKVGMSSCGIAAGAGEVFEALTKEAKGRGLNLEIKKCGCVGSCYAEPLVEVRLPCLPTVLYSRVNKEIALRILDEHIVNKRLLNDLIIDLPMKR